VSEQEQEPQRDGEQANPHSPEDHCTATAASRIMIRRGEAR
jgi:hypothetical protein